MRSFFLKFAILDLRSLALFRIAAALVLLLDLATRVVDLKAHYSDLGVLPRATALEHLPEAQFFSIHFISGSVSVQGVIFLLAAICAIALLIGWHTRLATIASWILFVSLNVRNPLLLDSGDFLFRTLLFWGMFLPLGAKFSVDSVKKPMKNLSSHTSIACVGFILQLALMYVCAALLKTGAPWQDGTAITQALAMSQYVTPLGHWLKQWGELLKPLTIAVRQLEMWGPVGFLLPWWPLQFLTIIIFILMHIGFNLCLDVGLFSCVAIAGLLALLPPQFWQLSQRHVVFSRYHAASLRVLKKISAQLNKSFLIDSKSPRSKVWIFYRELTAAFFLIVLVLTNLEPLPNMGGMTPTYLNQIAQNLRLEQRWGMFAPQPRNFDGWYVIEGKQRDGQIVDVFHQQIQPPSWEVPSSIHDSLPNNRWQKYLEMLTIGGFSQRFMEYGKYLCRDWNDKVSPEKVLDVFQIYFMRQEILVDASHSNAKKELMWQHYCFDNVVPSHSEATFNNTH